MNAVESATGVPRLSLRMISFLQFVSLSACIVFLASFEVLPWIVSVLGNLTMYYTTLWLQRLECKLILNEDRSPFVEDQPPNYSTLEESPQRDWFPYLDWTEYPNSDDEMAQESDESSVGDVRRPAYSRRWSV